MAKIYTVKKNGETAYPRTISDAVAVAGSTLTDALNNIKVTANLAYGEAAAKQPILESGENIKTVGGESILGMGDMAVVKGLYDAIGGRTYTPDESGTVQVPYAPLGGISQNGKLLNPDSMGIVTIGAVEVKEWVGTQAEFDELTTYDEKTTYYIV